MTRGFSLIKVGYGLLLGVTGILHIFRLVLEMKAGKEIPASSRLEFFEKFSANNFALSHGDDNTPGPLQR